MAVDSVLEVTVVEFVKENEWIFVDNFLVRLDRNIDKAVEGVFNETVDRYYRTVLEVVPEAIAHTDIMVEVQVEEETIGEVVNEALGHPGVGDTVGDTDQVQNVLPDGSASCGVGAKLLKSG